eukprot:scaffold45970_cov17-Tisochrysis_lutea.AAC.1
MSVRCIASQCTAMQTVTEEDCQCPEAAPPTGGPAIIGPLSLATLPATLIRFEKDAVLGGRPGMLIPDSAPPSGRAVLSSTPPVADALLLPPALDPV